MPQKGTAREKSSPPKQTATKPSNAKQQEEEAQARELKLKEEERERKQQEAQRLEEQKLREQRERDLTEQRAKETERQAQQKKDQEARSTQRKKLLDELQQKKKEALASLEAERDKKSEAVVQLQKKIADIKSRAGIKTRRQGGVTVTDMPPSSAKVDRALAQAEKLEKEVRDLTSRVNGIELSINTKNRKYWMEERTIISENPLPGDPKYTEYLGMLYTEPELRSVKKFMAEHGTPWAAGDSYIEELKAKGAVEDASHVGAPFPNTLPGGGLCLQYQVRYVSQGGLVMDRKGVIYVNSVSPNEAPPLSGGVFLPDGSATDETFSGKYWRVSGDTRMVGIAFPSQG